MLNKEKVEAFISEAQALPGTSVTKVINDISLPLGMEWFSCLLVSLGLSHGGDEKFQAVLNVKFAIPSMVAPGKWQQTVTMGILVNDFFLKWQEQMTEDMKYSFTDRHELAMAQCFAKYEKFLARHVIPYGCHILRVMEGEDLSATLKFKSNVPVRSTIGFVFDRGLPEIPPLKVVGDCDAQFFLQSFVVWCNGRFEVVAVNNTRPLLIESKRARELADVPDAIDGGIVVFAAYTIGERPWVAYDTQTAGTPELVVWQEYFQIVANHIEKIGQLKGMRLVEECLANFDVYVYQFSDDKEDWRYWVMGETSANEGKIKPSMKENVLQWATCIRRAVDAKDDLREMIEHLHQSHTFCIPELKGQYAMCFCLLKYAIRRMKEEGLTEVDYLRGAMLMFGSDPVTRALEKAEFDLEEVKSWKPTPNDYSVYLRRPEVKVENTPRRLADQFAEAVKKVMDMTNETEETLEEYEALTPQSAYYAYLASLS